MIDSEEVHYGGVEIVDVEAILDGAEAELIGLMNRSVIDLTADRSV